MPNISVSRVINAPREQVWAVVSDLAGARRWNAIWSRIEVISQQAGAGARFRAYGAEGQAFDFEVSEWVPPEYIEFSPVRDPSERYDIMLESQAFRLTPADEAQTHVELVARASAHGLKGRLIALILWPGYQRQGLNTALDSLQAMFEPSASAGREVEQAPPPAD